MEVSDYIDLRKKEVFEFRELVKSEGIKILKDVLNNECFDNIIREGERIWQNELKETFSGHFFPFRWLYEEKEWNFINTNLGKLYGELPKKAVIRNKLQDIKTNNLSKNMSMAFELKVICRFLADRILVDIDHQIDESLDTRKNGRNADALVMIDARNILVEVTAFELPKRNLPRVGCASIEDNIYKIGRNVRYKRNHQLQYSNRIPTVLIINIPPNQMNNQIQAKWAVENYFNSEGNESISAIIVSDSYLFKYGAWYFNDSSKFPLTDKEREYFSGCIKINDTLRKISLGQELFFK